MRVYFAVEDVEYDVREMAADDFGEIMADPGRCELVGYPAYYKEDNRDMLWPQPPKGLKIRVIA